MFTCQDHVMLTYERLTIWVNTNPICLLNELRFLNSNTTHLLNELVKSPCLSDFIKIEKKKLRKNKQINFF